jgi:hypothetical protein
MKLVSPAAHYKWNTQLLKNALLIAAAAQGTNTENIFLTTVIFTVSKLDTSHGAVVRPFGRRGRVVRVVASQWFVSAVEQQP